MAKLRKSIKYTYIPADPGFPGFPGRPYTPAYSAKSCYVKEKQCYSGFQPVYCTNEGTTYSYLCGYDPIWACTEEETICSVVNYPEQAELPPIPARSPTPAQTIENLQLGWNASAQSVASIAVDEGYLFQVANGSRGVLLGISTEPWVPNVGQLQYGIMFSDGNAQVYEGGVFGDQLGTFFRGEEFIIARAENYVLYYNMTAGIYSITYGIPAAPTVPLYLFALMYQGGDTVLT